MMPHFRHIRTRLSVLYAGLFVLALALIATVAQTMIVTNISRVAVGELNTSRMVFDRVWTLRSRSLSDSAGLLARDYGFRDAVGSGDAPTIASALANLRQRLGSGETFLVTSDGDTVGGRPGALRDAVAQLPFTIAEGRHSAVIAAGDKVYQMIVAPVLAPQEIGWVVFAVDLGPAEMRNIERLSAIPLQASVLRRDARGGWIGTGDAKALTPLINATLNRHADDGRRIRLRGGDAYVLAAPLPGATARPDTVLVLNYAHAAAMAPYRPLQLAVILAGLIGLALVLIGSLRLAKAIARPISALEEAANALEKGDRTTVEVEGDDEIARLAKSFNAMSRGIADREDRTVHLAFHDSLTSLPNRVLFREQLESGLRQAVHRQSSLAILCIDLDGFKGVNDTLGHPVGDEMLKIVGTLLTALAGDAFVARLGGDEFAIILHDGDGDRPRAVSQAIVDALREPMMVGAHRVMTGASIGIAMGPGDGTNADILLKNADLALYRAKQEGRCGFRFFEPSLDAQARARRQLELDMREALATGQFSLDFQPILSLKSDHIQGFEALLRWHHPTRGLVSPVEFIPIAEDTGLIIPIGEWVLQEACRQAATWPDNIRVAVNVSPLQFRNPGLQGVIVQAVARSGIAANRLEIEMTESIFVENTEATLSLLHSLRNLGIRIALDDFGTGYSSLSYLRAFPFDKIKIDRSFVSGIEDASDAAAIVRAIVDLASALGMETTAEGVELEQQMDELRRQGCGSMQGFLYSRPVSAGEVAALLGRDGQAEGARRAA